MRIRLGATWRHAFCLAITAYSHMKYAGLYLEGALMKLWFVLFAAATLAPGCVSPPAKPTADGSVTCTFPQPGGTSFCQVATNLTPKQVTNQMSVCTSMQGTVVAACPDGAVGCCATTSGTVDFSQCYYGISVATGEKTCATMMGGIWTVASGTSDAGATD